MAYSLPLFKLMKLSDFLIIYLSCGAPFGVFFFLQNRKRENLRLVYLQSFCLALVWIPYAVYLLHDFVTNHFRQHNQKNPVRRLDILQKEIEQFLFDSHSAFSIFELREVFERYVGLTLADNSGNQFETKTDEEIFRVALRQNVKLGATCLRRRNNERIAFHQNSARRDFLNFILLLKSSTTNQQQLQKLTTEFIQTLNDFTASDELDKIFAHSLQNSPVKIVQSVEDLWISDNQKLSPSNKIPLRLRALTATRKD